ncbi:MAG: hypothetical protein CVU90_10570 [Firmicutes bacterium HGW-Firmicutes-15]|nr:MAG: hypothetical protein CVU90_10570 [Firmicutes bacterium HGW-Firmicutes-15]
MSRKVIGFVLGLGLIASLGLGFVISDALRTDGGNKQQKPAIQVKSAELRLDAETPIVLEKEYLRSHKILISDFEYKQDIIGSTLDEIRAKYTESNGFVVTFKDSSLIIHQTIDDWSPEDKAKYRLKEFRGMVAIYIGPNSENDSLQRVTAIRFSTLPLDIREAIGQGKYEFNNEEAINDALENLDEYF